MDYHDLGKEDSELSWSFWNTVKKKCSFITVIDCRRKNGKEVFNTRVKDVMGKKVFLSGFNCGRKDKQLEGLMKLIEDCGFKLSEEEAVGAKRVLLKRDIEERRIIFK